MNRFKIGIYIGLLTILSGLSATVFAQQATIYSYSKPNAAFCGLIKSVFYRPANKGADSIGIVTIISQKRVVKVLSVNLAKAFLRKKLPLQELRRLEFFSDGRSKLTWSSSGMHEFHQVCIEGMVAELGTHSNGVEFVDKFEKYHLTN